MRWLLCLSLILFACSSGSPADGGRTGGDGGRTGGDGGSSTGPGGGGDPCGGFGGVSSPLATYLRAMTVLQDLDDLCLRGIVASGNRACPSEAEEITRYQQEIASGTMTFDANGAAACEDAISHFDATRCWGPTPHGNAARATVHQACDTVLHGAVKYGATCNSDDECAAGYCYQPNDYYCPGTCDDFATRGEGCNTSIECAPGLVCSGGAPLPDGTYSPFLCHLAPDGVPLGGDCSGGQACAADGGCNGDTCLGTSGAAAGAPCETNGDDWTIAADDCAGRQVCTGLTYDAAHNISARGACSTPQGVGGDCVPGMNVVTGCYAGLFCDDTSKKCIGYAGVGGKCVNMGCAGNAICNSATNTCTTVPTRGQPCVDSQCDTGLVCDSTHTCVAPPPLGSPCASGECAAGLACDSTDTCVLLPKVGMACAGGACDPSAWCCTECGDRCVALLADGAGCTDDKQCLHGTCDRNTSTCATARQCP